MTQPIGYVDSDYLRTAAQLLGPLKARTYEWMQVPPGGQVLDVGCGPGIDTIPLAPLVGPSGHIVGIDSDPAMVAEANARAEEAGVAAWVKHQLGVATALPFAGDTFDAVHCERLFLHLDNPIPALMEMVRVTKPGGWIVVAETDHGAMSINSTEVDLERRLVRTLAERGMRNGYAGRQLRGLFNSQKLQDLHIQLFPVYSTDYAAMRYLTQMDKVEHDAIQAEIITVAELDRWQRSLEAAAAARAFFSSGCYVLCAGRRP